MTEMNPARALEPYLKKDYWADDEHEIATSTQSVNFSLRRARWARQRAKEHLMTHRTQFPLDTYRPGDQLIANNFAIGALFVARHECLMGEHLGARLSDAPATTAPDGTFHTMRPLAPGEAYDHTTLIHDDAAGGSLYIDRQSFVVVTATDQNVHHFTPVHEGTFVRRANDKIATMPVPTLEYFGDGITIGSSTHAVPIPNEHELLWRVNAMKLCAYGSPERKRGRAGLLGFALRHSQP